MSRPSEPTDCLPATVFKQRQPRHAAFLRRRAVLRHELPSLLRQKHARAKAVVSLTPQGRVDTAFQAFLYFFGIVLILLVGSMRIDF
jgi:hypothetical protein